MEGGDSPPQMKAQPPVSFTPADFPAKKLAGQVDFNPFSEQTKPQPQPMPQPPSTVALSAHPPPLRTSPPQPQNRSLSQPPVMMGPLLQQPVVSTAAHPSMRVMYCECFASGLYCDGSNCNDCCNNVENEAARREAVEATLERNRNGFKPKIASGFGVGEISSSAFSSSSSSSSNDDMLAIMGTFFQHQQMQEQMTLLIQLREVAKELTPSASRPRVKKRRIKRDRDAQGLTTRDPSTLRLEPSKRSDSSVEEAGAESVGESERWEGRKVVKRRLREKVDNTVVDLITTELKELSSSCSDMSQIFKDFITTRKEYRAQKMMMRKQKLRVHEDRIMMMDTSTMTPEQAAYIKQKRVEIMQKGSGHSLSTRLFVMDNFNAEKLPVEEISSSASSSSSSDDDMLPVVG